MNQGIMIPEALAEQLNCLVTDPGVYRFKDEKGTVIYVGKAKNLKKRVSSYFNRTHTDPKTAALVRKVVSLDTVVTATEKEALILESSLITRHKPRYNIILKDDKRYPSLRIDPNEAWPGLAIVRRIEKDGALYFGPYTSSSAVHATVKFINRHFKLRKCTTSTLKSRTRPCLNHQMGLCLAPCCLDVSREAYMEMVSQVILFLKGRTPELVESLRAEMVRCATEERFEEAAELRDRLFAVEKTLEKQVVVATDMGDRDVVDVCMHGPAVCITLMQVRSGVLLGSRSVHLLETMAGPEEVAENFICQYYEKHAAPSEVLVSHRFDGIETVSDHLRETAGRRVQLLFPSRGEKAKLMAMARKNGEKRLEEIMSGADADRKVLENLMKRLGMDRLPERIESYDNSNTAGNDPVSGMVVFENGRPKKSDYRTFRIKADTRYDDYASMAEVLTRRFGDPVKREPLPDLLMVDGGKGQLNVATRVLEELGLLGAFTVIGIAKMREEAGETQDKIYLPGRSNPVNMGMQPDLLLFLQRMRDEVHRFAITFQRRVRGKRSVSSKLDHVPGVGKKRKAMLLKHFGGITAMKAASADELTALPGITPEIAGAIRRALA
ncbi:excinuclease ABC subunit UvrC [Desulfoluna butyratoxydans]|uniref:UvrABC system protein C n=1 Tax=Desulfoluna butyratoxydans TaxID=231438 RepID=A0A4U8YQW8_9BACT|nr:excinuclease ABC subunit UvrC [Desulfoluna butyratoxydans]VFQ46666.1 uvrabc system subunit c [Desulfoluna butyratoxydans]